MFGIWLVLVTASAVVALKKAYTHNGDSDSDDSNSDRSSEASTANDSGENRSQADFHLARFRELEAEITLKNMKS